MISVIELHQINIVSLIYHRFVGYSFGLDLTEPRIREQRTCSALDRSVKQDLRVMHRYLKIGNPKSNKNRTVNVLQNET